MTDKTFLYIILIVYGVLITLGFIKLSQKDDVLPLPEVTEIVQPPVDLDSVYDLIHKVDAKIGQVDKSKAKTVQAIDIFKAITVIRDSDSLVSSINTIIKNAK